MTMIDQLTEHDRTALLARAQEPWERAPQNTMRAVFEWRGKNYVVSHSQFSYAFTLRKASRSTERKGVSPGLESNLPGARLHFNRRFSTASLPRLSTMSKVTLAPSARVLRPARSTAEIWTNTSFVAPSG